MHLYEKINAEQNLKSQTNKHNYWWLNNQEAYNSLVVVIIIIVIIIIIIIIMQANGSGRFLEAYVAENKPVYPVLGSTQSLY